MRAGMMLASYYGGICLGPVNTAAGHALAIRWYKTEIAMG